VKDNTRRFATQPPHPDLLPKGEKEQEINAGRRFERDVLGNIPLAAAMRIHVVEADAARLVLAAPLATNCNHEGVAFGGAIECLGTLACWGMLWLALVASDATIVIQHGEAEFFALITGELHAEALRPETGAWECFVQAFARHGRARIGFDAAIGTENVLVTARFRGPFVAKRKANLPGNRKSV
jgi:thioesterase domain-containing protein